jgi:hypothetical protein
MTRLPTAAPSCIPTGVRADVGLLNLPVVIVQIGSWAQSLNRGKGIDLATVQTAAVKADQYARIVNTADLNGYYHYNPAAQLSIGERVALAVQSLLAAVPAAKCCAGRFQATKKPDAFASGLGYCPAQPAWAYAAVFALRLKPMAA